MYLSGIALPSTYYVHPPHLAIINLSTTASTTHTNSSGTSVERVDRVEREIMT